MLKVENIRLGFANNSSSSHSILLCNAAKHKEKDYLVDYKLSDGEPYFGWEGFICASPEAKAKYFACQLAQTLRPEVGAEIAGLTVSALLGVSQEYGNGSIDHQSELTFPRYRDGKIAVGFIKELFNIAINDPRVVIGGGNDNDSDSSPLTTAGKTHPWFASLPLDQRESYLIAREEPYGWCLFNTLNGTRVRLRRDNAKSDLPKTPELVDIKLTGKCLRGCKFCYQGSDYDGKHSDQKWVEHLGYGLAKMGVLEVVFGGGEPTQYPGFLEIIERFKVYHNIIPNFTTANASWLREPEFVKKVVKYVGSVAFSCQDEHEMSHFAREILMAGKELAQKAVLQTIVGIVSPQELERMVSMAHGLGFNKYSLVGYKSTGRASSSPKYAPNKYDLEALIKDRYGMRFYADTALLTQFPEIIEKYTCDVTEGKQSMYIDAVVKQMAPSSYVGDSVNFVRQDYPMEEEISQAFCQFQGQKPQKTKRKK
jgi:MoaA/NifB/PqqE/SkfB family radical SAM enzyme